MDELTNIKITLNQIYVAVWTRGVYLLPLMPGQDDM